MDGAGDIGVVSIPFVAGTAAAAVLISSVAGAALQMPAAVIALASSAIIIIISTLKNWGRANLAFLFFFTGAFCFLSYSSIPEVAGPSGLPARAVLHLRALIASIPFPHEDTSHMLTALLTGDRSGISREMIGVFRDSGASHILALSGLHLGVIYLIIKRLTIWFGNTPTAMRVRSVLLVTASGFYALMTGAGPSVIRAWLFITLHEFCSLMPERVQDNGRTLAIALMLQLAMKPSVITSLGFQLSYLAMCGIVFLFPNLKAWYPDDGPELLKQISPFRRIWNGAALAISCQTFTAPLVWITFHTFPKFFIITNLTALPLTTAIIMTAVVVTILFPLGVCPQEAVDLVDGMVQLLVKILTIISSL